MWKSRKLAVASWRYSCFSKGRGRPESNTVIFHREPPSPPPPKLPGHFEAVLEADGHELKSCQVSKQSVFSISKSNHPLGPQVCPGACSAKHAWERSLLVRNIKVVCAVDLLLDSYVKSSHGIKWLQIIPHQVSDGKWT